jgi:hypothetical protein
LAGGVAGTDLTHEGEHVAAAAARPEPDSEAIGVHVIGTEDVAGAVAAVVVGALALGAPARRPACSGDRPKADRSHLIKADDRPVARRFGAQRQHPSGLRLVVGIGAGLPRAGALEGQAGLGQQRTEMASRDLDDVLVGKVDRQPRQRPARKWNPLLIGTGTGHGDDLLTLISRDPAGTPAR